MDEVKKYFNYEMLSKLSSISLGVYSTQRLIKQKDTRGLKSKAKSVLIISGGTVLGLGCWKLFNDNVDVKKIWSSASKSEKEKIVDL